MRRGRTLSVRVVCAAMICLAGCSSSATKQSESTTTSRAPTSPASSNTTITGSTDTPTSSASTTSKSVATSVTIRESSVATTEPAASGSMMVSGSVTDTLSQSPTTTGKCRPLSGEVVGAALFGGSTGRYIVAVHLPAGTFTFPTTGVESIVLTSAADNKNVWVISKEQPSAKGTASLDGTHATVDVDLVPGASSTLGPLHLKGSLDC
jgi:hypothetical protein